MTAQEKNEVLEFKRSGASVPQVARKFNLSIPMAKKIIYSVKENEIYCIQCGKPTKRRNILSKFCSKKCKQRYYKEHPEYLKKITIHTSVCPCCHKEFTFYGRSHQTYCSRSCTKKHYFIKRNRPLS